MKESFFLLGKNAAFDKLFVMSVFCYYIFSFLLPNDNQFFIRILPLVIGFSIYALYLFVVRVKLTNKDFISLVLLCFFSLLAVFYIYFQFGLVGLFTMESLFFLSLPFFFIAAKRLSSELNLRFIYKFFLFFMLFQLFLMLGQAMKKMTGVGFSTPAEYSTTVDQVTYATMLTGSFMNANDLASVAVMVAVLFLLLKHFHGYRIGFGLGVIFVILLLTVSRMSIFLYAISLFSFWVYDNRFRLSKIFIFFIFYLPLIISLFVILYSLLDSYGGGGETLVRIKHRLDTFALVFHNGISADNSMSERYTSYLNFINNLTQLEYGSVKLRDYSFFVSHLGPKFDLFAINPHSFIVEVGYWLGWFGLALFGAFLSSLCYLNRRCLYSLFIFICISMVSSSIINNFLLFFCFFMTFFASKKYNSLKLMSN